jgi:hypothetical protein
MPLELMTQPVSAKDDHDVFVSTLLYAWRSECLHGDAISAAELQRLQHTFTELLRVALQSEGITLLELRVFAGALLRRTL